MIEVEKACKIYPSDDGDVEALRDIDLNVSKGRFVSLVGPSGCGKTTLLKCIAGLQPLSDGKISIFGKPIDGPPDNMGMVFQSDVLLDWRTILNNVLLPTEFRGIVNRDHAVKAKRLLQRFGLEGFEGKRPWELSGGMRQRASICRALLDDPELLFMDEPFGALDAMTRDDLNLELARLWQEDQKTVLFITHSIAEAVFLSDEVVVMSRNPGRIVDHLVVDIDRPRSLSVRQSREFLNFVVDIRHRFAKLGILKEA